MLDLEGPAMPAPLHADMLRKQILKLRWIGQDDDADRLMEELVRLEADTILIGEFETD